MKELIGKKINKIWISEGEHDILFETDQGTVSFTTDGSCCSETWIADILGVDALMGGTVASSENIEVPQVEDDRGRQDSDIFYGVKIKTEKGTCDLIYRNSSNGYYDGDMSFNKDLTKETMDAPREIKDDFKA